jgi:hypothetical protein
MEVKDVTRCAFMAPDPKLLTIDLAAHEQRMTEHRAEMAKLNPPKPEGPAKELARLRRELFVLEQRAKNTETYCNNKAGEVRLLEEQLTDAINRKKMAVAAGNAIAERNHEHSITRLEGEKAGVEKEFHRARRVSADTAHTLKEWQTVNDARLVELQKIVGVTE